MGPNLGDVEDVPLVLEAVEFRHDLNFQGPADRVALGEVVE